jgi:hypothetical protein
MKNQSLRKWICVIGLLLIFLVVGWEPSYAKEFKPPEKLGPTEFDYSTINHFLCSGQKRFRSLVNILL